MATTTGLSATALQVQSGAITARQSCVKVFALAHPTSRVRCHKFPQNATRFFTDTGASDSGMDGLLRESEQSGAGGKGKHPIALGMIICRRLPILTIRAREVSVG